MFILRQFKKGNEGYETNRELGDVYGVITSDKEGFENIAKELNYTRDGVVNTEERGIFGFLKRGHLADLEDLIPLFKDENYYIVNSEGRTYSRINPPLR